jgi:predicted transcriptional regulator
MSKVPISQKEFELLCEAYKAPKTGDHICWREFSDTIDEVFTSKGLEKNVDATVGNAPFNTTYGRIPANESETDGVQRILEGFTEVIRKERLDAKSFFQDWDRHKRFKVSQKQFSQVLTLLKYPLNAEDTAIVAKIYGNHDGEIRYADFLKDSNCLTYTIHGPFTGAKSTYTKNFIDFQGATTCEDLMTKIKNIVKKDGIRLREFFQDHDILRKGYLPKMKFRNVLHAQKIQLTSQEYDRLEAAFAQSNDPSCVNYVSFNT